MEDGWILAQALACFANDTGRAGALFNEIRLPYYAKMYTYLASEAARRAEKAGGSRELTFDERVRGKVIPDGGRGLEWIYHNDIETVWRRARWCVGIGGSSV
jgi:salicylate hydroxylase